MSLDSVIEDPEEEFEEFINKLKKKCAVVDKGEKVKIISLLPSSWTRKRTATEFNVSGKTNKGTSKRSGHSTRTRKEAFNQKR